MSNSSDHLYTTELTDNGILVVTINIKHETMNVLNQEVIAAFSQLIDTIETNSSVTSVILSSGKAQCFIAGADIKMLQKTQTAEEGRNIVASAHQLLLRISESKKPFIAAIDGVCLGAGYELALACHYRLATDNPATKIGLPEVMIGLLPGATGTTKLSRLISLPSALDILLTGKQLNAKRAQRVNMIDEVVPTSILLDAAKKVAKQFTTNRQQFAKKMPLLQRLYALPLISHFIIYQAKKSVLKKTNGLYPAPLAILDVIQYGLHKPLAKALAFEAKKFGELSVSKEAKALINIYFATTELKKETFTPKNSKPENISHLGILGGGLMGAGIATVSIDKANINVRMKDIKDDGLLSAHQYVHQYYSTRLKRRILSLENAKKKINQLSSALDYSGFQQCQLIIEAVFEDLSIKQKMVEDIENLRNENTIFASNTSSIPIKSIAAKAKRPENIIGMHYFSPVEKMPLLEIIKHAGTSEKTIATAVALGRQQGKTVIVVNDGAGFYVNRILAPYINAALRLGMEGVPFEKIDQALVNFGFPVGPIKLLDEVGIDIAHKIQPILEESFGERMKSCGIQETLIANKRLGKKVKKGFYHYQDKRKKNTIDPSVYTELSITPTAVIDEEKIVQRCLYPMLHEAHMCLEEGIISCERDGDIGAIFGIGFPPYLGGPFQYMKETGMIIKPPH